VIVEADAAVGASRPHVATIKSSSFFNALSFLS
jgi:hypothetical protein